MNYSKTYIAAIATLLASLTFLSDAEALNLINAIILIATTLGTLYGRYQAGNVDILGRK